jgi:glutamate--cysteine ligase
MFSNGDTVPFLAVKKVAGLQKFEQHLLAYQIKIERWFRQNWLETPPPFYASVDLRNAGFKLAPIDTNLFPAGFNNLNKDFDPLCIQAVQATLQQNYPDCSRILFIPESHTRNPYYFENVARQLDILMAAGYEVHCGSLRQDLTAAENITLPSGQSFLLQPIRRQNNRIFVNDFSPCLVLLNNDFSDGIPEILLGLEQTLLPPIELGWSTRKKSTHFSFYDQVAEAFSQLIDIDPWLINPYFDVGRQLNFLTGEGVADVADKAAVLFDKIKVKYSEYQIKEEPFLIVKANSGTYGMGIIQIKDPNELLHLNRKQRTKMSMSKGNQAITQVMLQEGVPSFERVGEKPATAEPVVYMMGQFVVGGFYRVHAQRGHDEVLNAPGMHFEPLAFAKPCCAPKISNQFYAYGVVARLALLAAAYEALGATVSAKSEGRGIY